MKILKPILVAILLGLTCIPALAQADAIREVEWTLNLDSVVLHGTLATPQNQNQKTAIMFISGSGPTDRDGNNPFMKNNSIKGLSDSLVIQGYTTLRFDKRGIAESAVQSLDESTLTLDDYVTDASHWLDRLKDSFPEYTIVVAGHSEGSLIGILLAQTNEVDGFISLAGTGRTFDVIIHEQLEKQMPALVPESDSIMELIRKGETVDEMNPMLLSLYRPSVQPYMRSLLKYDPATEIGKLTVPILIVQGENDIQITPEDAKALHAASDQSTLELIPHMNHILKNIESGYIENQASYGNPELPISPELLKAIKSFLINL